MKAQMPAVANSIKGYCAEIGSPHPRQRARRMTQESTGMLSYQDNRLPQRGQRDGGRTTDCFGSAPQRRMQTLRKLPMIAPKITATTTSSPAGSSSATGNLIQENTSRHGDVQRFHSPHQGN